jgi:23S rRNA (cytosine1962-C5)-methyltransferase
MLHQASARLKPGKEKHIQKGHPWVFSGAVEEWQGELNCGAVTDVLDHSGIWLARGLLNPESSLAIRLCTWNPEQPIDADFFALRLDAAIAQRERIFADAIARQETNAYRLFFSEADGISGLIVDKYADALMVQVGAKALIPHLDVILNHLKEETGSQEIVVRAENESDTREGMDLKELAARSRVSAQMARIKENSFLFDVDLRVGQKTGFFLDQRMNRQRVAAYAKDRRILSAYCYTGAFEIYAAAAGAKEVIGIDRSDVALDQARFHHELNRTHVPIEYVKADVPEALRKLRDAGRTFDMIILDPPKFVSNRAQKEKGMRAYKDINLLAMKLLTPGGVLASFSCSGQITTDDFKTMIGWAAIDSGRRVTILETLGQPADHPVLAIFPESEYLKGVICWVV